MSDDIEKAYWATQGLNAAVAGPSRQRTKLERLHDTKRGLEAKLAEVNKAIELLEGNPKINEIIEALEKAGV